MGKCGTRMEPDKRVRVTVLQSKCPFLERGCTFELQGPLIENEKSANICTTSLLAIYPWIIAARFGIESQNMDWEKGYRVWCPEKMVEFLVITIWDD